MSDERNYRRIGDCRLFERAQASECLKGTKDHSAARSCTQPRSTLYNSSPRDSMQGCNLVLPRHMGEISESATDRRIQG